MSAPRVLDVRATVRCECNRDHTFLHLQDEWERQRTCPCGRVISIQTPIVECEFALRQTVYGRSA